MSNNLECVVLRPLVQNFERTDNGIDNGWNKKKINFRIDKFDRLYELE